MWAYYFFHGTLRVSGNPLPIYGVTRADIEVPPDEVYMKLVEQEAASRSLPVHAVEIDAFTKVGSWQEPEKPVDFELPVPEPEPEPVPERRGRRR